jgi:hypothetical protein
MGNRLLIQCLTSHSNYYFFVHTSSPTWRIDCHKYTTISELYYNILSLLCKRIGAAIVKELGREGAAVVINYCESGYMTGQCLNLKGGLYTI